MTYSTSVWVSVTRRRPNKESETFRTFPEVSQNWTQDS